MHRFDLDNCLMITKTNLGHKNRFSPNRFQQLVSEPRFKVLALSDRTVRSVFQLCMIVCLVDCMFVESWHVDLFCRFGVIL